MCLENFYINISPFKFYLLQFFPIKLSVSLSQFHQIPEYLDLLFVYLNHLTHYPLIFTIRNNVLIRSTIKVFITDFICKNCFYKFHVEYFFLPPSAIFQLKSVSHAITGCLIYTTYCTLVGGDIYTNIRSINMILSWFDLYDLAMLYGSILRNEHRYCCGHHHGAVHIEEVKYPPGIKLNASVVCKVPSEAKQVYHIRRDQRA